MAKKSSGKGSTSGPIPSGGRSVSGKRELTNTGTDKRFVRRGSGGQFKESGTVGKSLVSDKKATTDSRAATGERGDKKSSSRGDQGETNQYVRTDDGGAMRVGAGDVPLDSVVAAFHQGHSPEMIRAQYPSLKLEEIYGAIAYYLAHRDGVDAYLGRQDALWDQWRNQTNAAKAPVVRRLRSAAHTPAPGPQEVP